MVPESPTTSYTGCRINCQTPQLLVRFRQEVIALEPAVVVILAGTKDMPGNTSPSTPEMTEDNIAPMRELLNGLLRRR